MKDSRVKSLTEAGCNIVVGFACNFLANMVFLPMIGTPFSLKNFGLVGIGYTFVSLARSYLLRRLFVNGFYEAICNLINKIRRKE